MTKTHRKELLLALHQTQQRLEEAQSILSKIHAKRLPRIAEQYQRKVKALELEMERLRLALQNG